MQANWGTILFILGVGPICWILSKTNLRFASLLSCGLMTAGTLARIFTYHDEEIFLYTANACSILNGITGILVMAAPAALSAAWFPANERATATSISQVLNAAGNGFSYLLGPLIVLLKFGKSYLSLCLMKCLDAPESIFNVKRSDKVCLGATRVLSKQGVL